MDANAGLPDQGFSGELVHYDDGYDVSHDWRGEYGPKAVDKGGEWTYRHICCVHPLNKWCIANGYVNTDCLKEEEEEVDPYAPAPAPEPAVDPDAPAPAPADPAAPADPDAPAPAAADPAAPAPAPGAPGGPGGPDSPGAPGAPTEPTTPFKSAPWYNFEFLVLFLICCAAVAIARNS